MNPLATLDDYTLASFMAGTLPSQQRQKVAAHLARDAYARELLQMACEALDASHLRAARLLPTMLETAAPKAAPANHKHRRDRSLSLVLAPDVNPSSP